MHIGLPLAQQCDCIQQHIVAFHGMEPGNMPDNDGVMSDIQFPADTGAGLCRRLEDLAVKAIGDETVPQERIAEFLVLTDCGSGVVHRCIRHAGEQRAKFDYDSGLELFVSEVVE